MSYTIPNIILWAKISQSLAARDIAVNKAKGITQNDILPEILYDVRTSLEWKYAKNATDVSLFNVGDYLYSLCGKYLSRAKELAAVGGGIVINTNSSNYFAKIIGFDLEISVGAGQSIVNGQTSYVIDIANVVEGTVKVQMPQSNIPQSQSNQFSYSVSYGANSTKISFTNDDGNGNNLGVQEGMLIMISGLRIMGYGVDFASNSIQTIKEVETHAIMLSKGVPDILTRYKVLNDEVKGIENAIYEWWPDGSLMWIASVKEIL